MPVATVVWLIFAARGADGFYPDASMDMSWRDPRTLVVTYDSVPHDCDCRSKVGEWNVEHIQRAGPPQECVGSAHAPALDHVILATRDLDSLSARFRSSGFVLKQGRLHPNRLLNRHIKFRDGSSIELMTVQGAPGDAMARGYASLAAEGEGGVYVALKVTELDGSRRGATRSGLSTSESRSGPWEFLSFPDTSPAAAVFFSAGSATVQDPDSIMSHVPAVDGLAEALLEGGPELAAYLEALGAKRCGTARGPDGRSGERIGLGRGNVVIVPSRSGRRPRVLGVVLRLRDGDPISSAPHPSFWVQYR